MLDDLNIEHKKEMYLCVPPQVQTAEPIQTETDLIDDDFIDLQTKFDEVNNVATEQKKNNNHWVSRWHNR